MGPLLDAPHPLPIPERVLQIPSIPVLAWLDSAPDVASGMLEMNSNMSLAACAWCFQVIGSPSDEDLMFISSEKARRYIRSLPKHEHVDFRKLYPNANEQVRPPHLPKATGCRTKSRFRSLGNPAIAVTGQETQC